MSYQNCDKLHDEFYRLKAEFPDLEHWKINSKLARKLVIICDGCDKNCFKKPEEYKCKCGLMAKITEPYGSYHCTCGSKFYITY